MYKVVTTEEKKNIDINQSLDDKDLIVKILGWKDDSEDAVGTWEQSQEKWHKLRMRIKKDKNFPFKGCANIRMPTLEVKIRKLKAALTNVLFGIKPIVQVIPSPSGNWEVARKIEKFLDHLVTDVMQIKKKIIIAIDQTLEKGFYLVKPYWKVRIDNRCEDISLKDIAFQEAAWLFDPMRRPEEVAQAIAQKFNVDMSPRVADENKAAVEKAVSEVLSGKTKIKMYVRDVVCDYPDVALCPPERVYVPPSSGFDPQECQYIIHEFYLPLETVKQNAEHKGWDKLNVKDIEDLGSIDLDDKSIDLTKDTREGITRINETGLVKIIECYCYYDINNDGVNEKCIITVAEDFGKILRKIVLPFYTGKFPFVKFFYELTDDRWFSHRGLPEIIEDIVKEIDIQHMQKLDYGTIANSPMFLYRAGQVSKNATQFLFGQGLPVHGMQPLSDVFAPLNKQNPNIEFSYKDEQMILESKVEELTGQIDFTLQSMINKRQPRTLGEVQLQQQNMRNVFSLDADIMRQSFEELLNWVYELWCQYGDDNYEFLYLGNDNSKGSVVKITKEELQGKYKITIRGNDENTNPQQKMMKAQQLLMAAQTPIFMQMGVVTPVNVFNTLKRFYQELDVPNWEELLTPPQPPPPPQANVRVNAKDLTDAEMAQVVQRMGLKPDVQGRYLNEQNRRDELEFDQLAEVADIMGKNKKKETNNGG